MDNNWQSVELEFRRQLLEQHKLKKHNSVLIPKAEYFNLIEDLKIAFAAESKSRRQSVSHSLQVGQFCSQHASKF